MPLDYRNINTLWTSILVETLKRLGLTTAIICPGSRSTPLTIAFAKTSHIETISILDERSASFFALGIAKRTRLPVALVCTSGTAAANFYPAVIEAKESGVPLLILTADRPPLLRNCRAGQTIDQVKLYGHYPNWQLELALPTADMEMLRYLRQNIIQAWERSLFPFPGPVHLNLPFTEPLAPIEGEDNSTLKGLKEIEINNEEEFFQGIETTSRVRFTPTNISIPFQKWQEEEKGIIIAGLCQSLADVDSYCKAIARLSQCLKWPVLAEALSPVRNYSKFNPYLISTYHFILHDRELADKLVPKMVVQIGELPTSKELRNWLNVTKPQRWIIEPTASNFDPLHGPTIHLRTSVEELAKTIPNISLVGTSEYLQLWCDEEKKVRKKIDLKMKRALHLYEGKVAWLLSQILPRKTPIFIANSMSVRYAEFFWVPGNTNIIPYFNRGANGIDGTLSTALGIAHRNKLPCVLLTGDLALLHDTNGFLLTKKFGKHFKGDLTIILINNNGGGIFEFLPVSKFDSQFDLFFENFFATPQKVNFAKLCLTYDIEHHLITSWHQLTKLLKGLKLTDVRVLELRTDRKKDASWLAYNML